MKLRMILLIVMLVGASVFWFHSYRQRRVNKILVKGPVEAVAHPKSASPGAPQTSHTKPSDFFGADAKTNGLDSAFERNDPILLVASLKTIDPNKLGAGKMSLLGCALILHRPLLFKTLLDYGANPNEVAMGGNTSVHMACTTPDVAYLRLVLDAHGSVTSPNEKLNTPLHIAAGNGLAEAVAILLSRPEIDLDARNRIGLTAAQLASKTGHPEIARLIDDSARARSAHSTATSATK
jgi:hypothetical protein